MGSYTELAGHIGRRGRDILSWLGPMDLTQSGRDWGDTRLSGSHWPGDRGECWVGWAHWFDGVDAGLDGPTGLTGGQLLLKMSTEGGRQAPRPLLQPHSASVGCLGSREPSPEQDRAVGPECSLRMGLRPCASSRLGKGHSRKIRVPCSRGGWGRPGSRNSLLVPVCQALPPSP